MLISAFCTYASIDLTIQNKWDEKFLISAAYMKRLSKSKQYLLLGINTFPSKTKRFIKSETVRTLYKFDSYYGLFTGYYYGFHPLFRPGIHIGSGFKREKEYTRHGLNGYTDFRLCPYYGIGLQSGIISLIISNEGIGGGINIVFRRR